MIKKILVVKAIMNAFLLLVVVLPSVEAHRYECWCRCRCRSECSGGLVGEYDLDGSDFVDLVDLGLLYEDFKGGNASVFDVVLLISELFGEVSYECETCCWCRCYCERRCRGLK